YRTWWSFSMFSICLMAVLWKDTFDPSVRGARVLVTDASTGIGEQVAYHYSKMGGQIVITARKEHALQKVAENSTSLGVQKALYVTGDVCQASDPESGEDGCLDVLVLNHIGSSPFAIWNGDREHVRELMQVNFLSYVNIASAALPVLEYRVCDRRIISPYAANVFFGTIQNQVRHTIHLQGHTNMMAYPASDAALHLITRQKSFCPVYMYLACLCRDWFPFFRDIVIENSYTY
uniref:Uncharacterized protein n=1 Tax=Salmo trutta TaxID=8032 RepID=A0A673YNG1_SALTR